MTTKTKKVRGWEELVISLLRLFMRARLISRRHYYYLCYLVLYKDFWISQAAHSRQQRHLRILIRRDGQCVYCGSTENLTQDHVIPRARGGSNSLSNKQLLCAPCNEAKADALPTKRKRV